MLFQTTLELQRTFSEEPPAFKVTFSCPAIKFILFFLQRLIWAPNLLNLKKPHISEQKHSTRPAGGKDGGQRRWLINRNSICSHCFSLLSAESLKNLLLAIRVDLLMMSWVDRGFDLERS